VREEAVPVELLGGLVPGPVGLFGVGEDDADVFVELVGVGPDVQFALGRARRRVARGLNQGCWSEVWLMTSSIITCMLRWWAASRNCLKSSSVP
jgi:hypothetical protein